MSEQQTGTTTPGEVFSFQAEMKQLMHIIIDSLYSEREIFLRELISNAADATEKLKFRTLTDQNVRDPKATLEITLEPKPEEKALIIRDTGIGMTREDLINNLGTIAKSGTMAFAQELAKTSPENRADLIGQFGVGFYSVFMVASRVVVDSCPADTDAESWRWISDGDGEFTLEPSDKKSRGTEIRVEFKEGQEEYFNPTRIEHIVQKYSNFVSCPVLLEGKQLNALDAIWAQSPSEVSEEQYQEFYRYITHGFGDPLNTQHLSIDAPVQYRALLFTPEHLTNEVLYNPNHPGIQLYTAKVLIQSEARDLLPGYLRFLRGVVDTEDLALNVSREMVQNDLMVERLRLSLTGRILRNMKETAEKKPEKYANIWKQYGKIIKEGMGADEENKERLLELLRFDSSASDTGEELISLKTYIDRMKDGQKEIFYLTGPTREALLRNPHLEIFRKKNLEVLLLADPVDDFMMAHLTEFQEVPFASIDSSNLESISDEGEDEESTKNAISAEAQTSLAEFLKEKLGERVADVTASKRLVDSAACLVNPEDMPANMQRMMKMMDKNFAGGPKILEFNPAHPLVHAMSTLREGNPEAPLLQELAEQLYDNCMLTEGLHQSPEQMVGRIQSLMTQAATLATGSVAGSAAGASAPKKKAAPKTDKPAAAKKTAAKKTEEKKTKK